MVATGLVAIQSDMADPVVSNALCLGASPVPAVRGVLNWREFQCEPKKPHLGYRADVFRVHQRVYPDPRHSSVRRRLSCGGICQASREESRTKRIIHGMTVAALALSPLAVADALRATERMISHDELVDKLSGFWIGQPSPGRWNEPFNNSYATTTLEEIRLRTPISAIVQRIAGIAKTAILENGGRMELRDREVVYIINSGF